MYIQKICIARVTINVYLRRVKIESCSPIAALVPSRLGQAVGLANLMVLVSMVRLAKAMRMLKLRRPSFNSNRSGCR